MPTCENCGSHVTDAYRRVFAPDGHKEARVCPYCPDKVRRDGEPRTARNERRVGNNGGERWER